MLKQHRPQPFRAQIGVYAAWYHESRHSTIFEQLMGAFGEYLVKVQVTRYHSSVHFGALPLIILAENRRIHFIISYIIFPKFLYYGFFQKFFHSFLGFLRRQTLE